MAERKFLQDEIVVKMDYSLNTTSSQLIDTILKRRAKTIKKNKTKALARLLYDIILYSRFKRHALF